MVVRPTQLLLPDPRQQAPRFPARVLAEVVDALADLMVQIVETLDDDDDDHAEADERGTR